MLSVFVTAVLVGGILWLLAFLRSRREAANARALQRALEAARDQAEQDQQLLARFLQELPQVVQELHGAADGRQLPGMLLATVTRLLEPGRAFVAVRRRAQEGERHARLAVAAVSHPDWIEPGCEFRIGTGEVGHAAFARRVMDRTDFDALEPAERQRLREETPAGLVPDVVAPMLLKDEVVGVIVVEGARRGTRDALRLLAQVGAIAVETQARNGELKATASLDGLTGTFNKRHLSQRLADALRRAIDSGSPVSLLLLDVDHFKRYNDRNGPAAGDKLLRELAKVVQGGIRRDAVFGRYGAGEFLVIFPGARRAQALAAAQNVRYAVANHPFEFGALQPRGIVTISGGVAEGPTDGRDAASLLEAADAARRRAKAEGRDRVVVCEPPAGTAGGFGPPDGLLGITPDGDFTPEPGALLSLASITPAGGVSVLTEHPRPEVLASALEMAPPLRARDLAPDATLPAHDPRLVVEADQMARRSRPVEKD